MQYRKMIKWDIFKRSSFIPYLTIRHVFELINKCIPEFAEKPILFTADEFSHVLEALRKNKKLSLLQKKKAISSITVPIYSNFCSLMFSGFETRSKVFFCNLSGRPVNSVWLLPVTQSEHHHYKPLIDQLMHFYKKNDQFPFAVYEWTKFSPGLMGRWLELLKTSIVVKSIDDITTIPMVDVTKSKVQNNPLFFARYWKECFDLINTKDILELRCMQKYEGVYLLVSHSKGFLNLFVIIHPDIVRC